MTDVGMHELSTLTEFDAIRRMLDRWGARATGIGDDAALLNVPRGDALVASVDSAVEGKHFKPEWLTPREISYRAVAAALSDLAAMAAHPVGVLVALTVPKHWRPHLLELADGIGDAVDVAGTVIRGGNLSDGSELSITTTVLGSAFAPVSRRGANVGDGVYVTGVLGAPAMAVRLLAAGKSAGAFRDRFARPRPRIAEALWLADLGISAAIDVSDGLIADVEHLTAATAGVSIEIEAAQVPRFEGVEVELALASGEEYELVVTAPSDLDTDAFERRFALPLTRIGVVTQSVGQAVVIRGARVGDVHGHDHFSG
jgi:thiamine-monophosphate kinase